MVPGNAGIAKSPQAHATLRNVDGKITQGGKPPILHRQPSNFSNRHRVHSTLSLRVSEGRLGLIDHEKFDFVELFGFEEVEAVLKDVKFLCFVLAGAPFFDFWYVDWV